MVSYMVSKSVWCEEPFCVLVGTSGDEAGGSCKQSKVYGLRMAYTRDGESVPVRSIKMNRRRGGLATAARNMAL